MSEEAVASTKLCPFRARQVARLSRIIPSQCITSGDGLGANRRVPQFSLISHSGRFRQHAGTTARCRASPRTVAGARTAIVERCQIVGSRRNVAGFVHRLAHRSEGGITACNGLEGVVAAHCEHPSVVLMDVTMPVLDGIEAARLIKASAGTRHMNILAHTAKPEFYEGPLTRFFVGVLRKPTTPEALVVAVRRFVEPPRPETEQVHARGNEGRSVDAYWSS